MDSLGSAPQTLLELREPEDVGALRRTVGVFATTLGASDAVRARAELVATELGTNVLLHARGLGYALLRPTDGPGLELLAVDRGPGIRDVRAVMRAPTSAEIEARLARGVRSTGLGCGLASVERLASEFDVHSVVGAGTVVLARFSFGAPPPVGRLRCGAVSLPMIHGDANGDAWALGQDAHGASLLVVDGLGHGPPAAVASGAAITEFRRRQDSDIDAYFHDAHLALRTTRGAAVFLCRIDLCARSLFFAGLGNVEGRVHSGGAAAGLTPRNGTLGMGAAVPKIVVRAVPFDSGATLVVHSDGLRSPASLDDDSALWQRDPSVIAAVLHRELARGRDDATVVVVQHRGATRELARP